MITFVFVSGDWIRLVGIPFNTPLYTSKFFIGWASCEMLWLTGFAMTSTPSGFGLFTQNTLGILLSHLFFHIYYPDENITIFIISNLKWEVINSDSNPNCFKGLTDILSPLRPHQLIFHMYHNYSNTDSDMSQQSFRSTEPDTINPDTNVHPTQKIFKYPSRAISVTKWSLSYSLHARFIPINHGL